MRDGTQLLFPNLIKSLKLESQKIYRTVFFIFIFFFLQPKRGWKWKVLEHNEDHFPFLMLPQIFTWSMKTSAWIPLSIQPEVCKQRWEIIKKKKFQEMNWVWTEPLLFGLASALVQGRAGLTSTFPPPNPPLPSPPLPIRIPCRFCYVASRSGHL